MVITIVHYVALGFAITMAVAYAVGATVHRDRIARQQDDAIPSDREPHQ